MPKRVTTSEFVERAKAVHGDRYDYSLAAYQGNHNHVTIVCPKHGQFRQSPANHCQGKGCPDCGGSKPHTSDSFVEAAKLVHGGRYDYSQVRYSSNKAHVTIICTDHGPFSQLAAVHLKGNGCPVCGGNKKHTIDSFIEKARAIHGNRYDYSQVDYKGAHQTVDIICPTHGPFSQAPTNHLAGQGCPECGVLAASNARRRTTSQFIHKATAIHGDRYDYSMVEYVGNTEKVSIICSNHGPFKQTPAEHLFGSGCAKCGRTAGAEARRKTTENFIARAQDVHANRYGYWLVEYLSAQEAVTIVCPDHGPFEQTPNGHLGGRGCYECGLVSSADAKRSSADQFIAKARMVHGDRYDYSFVVYTVNHKKVRIVCPHHGLFLQSPADHLNSKTGCPSCCEKGFNSKKPALLYYVAILTDDGGMRYKIGITNFSVEERFQGRDRARIRIVKIWRFEVGLLAAKRELEILHRFSKDRYCGPRLLAGNGNTEIFTHDILGLDRGDPLPGSAAAAPWH